jgi:hypothetical protein
MGCSIWEEHWESLQAVLPEELCAQLSQIVRAHGSVITSQLEGSDVPQERSTEDSTDGVAEEQKSTGKEDLGENDREHSNDLSLRDDAGMRMPLVLAPAYFPWSMAVAKLCFSCIAVQ